MSRSISMNDKLIIQRWMAMAIVHTRNRDPHRWVYQTMRLSPIHKHDIQLHGLPQCVSAPVQPMQYTHTQIKSTETNYSLPNLNNHNNTMPYNGRFMSFLCISAMLAISLHLRLSPGLLKRDAINGDLWCHCHALLIKTQKWRLMVLRSILSLSSVYIFCFCKLIWCNN